MDYRKSRKLLIVCIAVALVLILAAMLFKPGGKLTLEGPGKIVVLIGAAIAVIGVIQAHVFMRCPHCGGSLYSRGMPKYQHCPHCGSAIDWN